MGVVHHTMSASLIAIVTVIYTGVSLNEWWHGNAPMSLVWFGYALANIGLIIQAR